MKRLLTLCALFAVACGAPDPLQIAPDGDAPEDAAQAEDAPGHVDAALDGNAADGDATAEPDAGPIVDPCTSATPACPAPPAPSGEGKGLVAVDRCAFPMKAGPAWQTSGALVAALEALTGTATVAQVLASANRAATATTNVPGAPAGVKLAFRWNAEDQASTTWTPQGITGSADASTTGLVAGKRVVLVSWYHSPEGADPNKGVRIAFVDVTNAASPVYRYALLVTPTGSAQAPSFAPVPMHAGGIVWFGHYLYVAATGSGFRVFDLDHILPTNTAADTIGCAGGVCRAGLYAYAIPEVGAYVSQSKCDDLFSFVSLDRSTTPPSLLTGEYCSGTACATPLAGRLRRFALDATTGRLSSAPTFWPTEALFMQQRQVQGAASRAGVHYLSSSAPAAGAGALYRAVLGKAAPSTWLDAPEDLMMDEGSGAIWSLSEGAGARVVAAMDRASYPAP